MAGTHLGGKTAIVTGASQGWGQFLAVEMASEGAHVVLTARNLERLRTIEAGIRERGGSALAV